MKVVPLSEAKARLSHFGRMCRKEPVVVTVNGVPSFELVPLDEDDDLINQLIEHNPDFRVYLQKCLRSKTVSAEEAFRRLGKK